MMSLIVNTPYRFLNRHWGKGKAGARALGSTLVTVAQEEGVTNQRLQEVLPMHARDITFLLQGLVRKDFLVPEGFGRWTQYRLKNEGERHAGVQYSPLNNQSSPPNESSSPPKEANSPPNDPALRAIAAPVRDSDRARPEQVQEAILRLCAGRYLSIRDLSALLGRKVEKLRDRHVRELLDANRLELQYPDKPNHPQQGYRTKQA